MGGTYLQALPPWTLFLALQEDGVWAPRPRHGLPGCSEHTVSCEFCICKMGITGDPNSLKLGIAVVRGPQELPLLLPTPTS